MSKRAASANSHSQNRRSEVWIANRSDGVPGIGTLKDPYDGSTQLKLHAIMDMIPPETTIHFSSGTFVTKGIVPKTGWRLYLSSKTIVRLDVLDRIPGQKWAIFGAGSPNPVSDIWIEGGVWDCNLQNQNLHLAAQAISFISGDGNITINKIKVINWGSTLKGAECFVVSVFNTGSTGKVARNVTLDGIEVTQPAPIVHLNSASLIGANGQDPVNPKALSNGWIEKVNIRHCYVHDIDIPVIIASVQMGGWCRDVHIHDNRFENLGPKNNTLSGCYLDTGSSENLLVEKNVFSGVVHGVWASLSTPYPVGNWIIRNNRILINRTSASGGIELRGVNTTIRNLIIEKNTIASSTGAKLSAYGIVLGNVSNATIRQNTIDDINGWNQIVFETNVEDSRLINNHTRADAVLKERNQRVH